MDSTMTPALALLHQVGESLWGRHWQTDMSEALGVSDRTVRRWGAGDRVGSKHWVRLACIMRDRRLLLADLIAAAGTDAQGAAIPLSGQEIEASGEGAKA